MLWKHFLHFEFGKNCLHVRSGACLKTCWSTRQVWNETWHILDYCLVRHVKAVRIENIHACVLLVLKLGLTWPVRCVKLLWMARISKKLITCEETSICQYESIWNYWGPQVFDFLFPLPNQDILGTRYFLKTHSHIEWASALVPPTPFFWLGRGSASERPHNAAVSKEFVYKCPFCRGHVASRVRSGQVNHRGACGKRSYVKDGIVCGGTRQYRHICPLCHTTVWSAQRSGRSRVKHRTAAGWPCAQQREALRDLRRVSGCQKSVWEGHKNRV